MHIHSPFRARVGLGTSRAQALLPLAVCLSVLLLSFAAPAQIPTPNANQYGPGLIGLTGPTGAWTLGYSGAGITVAVSDSGIDTTHPAFTGKIDSRSMNFTLPSQGAPYVTTQITDTGSHGTHVAGIIASSTSGPAGAPGVAYNANLVVLRSLNGCATGQDCDPPGVSNSSAAALNYFAGLTNVMVYNASYGPNVDKGSTTWGAKYIDPTEETAALGAITKGKIIVAANGNDRDTSPVAGANPYGLALDPFIQPGNANAGVYQDGNNNYDFSALLNQPGLIIAVTSVGQNKLSAYYAQYCGVTASWCVAAPGGDQSLDNGIWSTIPASTYGYQQGTSMAAPAVSGGLAVLQQAYPGYAARDLANVLFATAENVGGQAADNAIYGYGLIRLDRAVAGPTTLAAGSNIVIGAQQVTYWSQPLTTGGAFSVGGPGYLIVAGRTTATGDVTVNGGALGVDGTLTLQTKLTVAPGGTLAGFGAVVGNALINGTIGAGQLPNYADLIANNGGTLPAGIPLSGTSPGTLTFQGSVTLAAGATMLEDIDGAVQIPGGPGTYSKIIVTGAGASFAANGVLVPVLRGIPGGTNTYVPPIGTRFPIVTAQNGATITADRFTAVTQPAVGLGANSRLDVVYLPTSITVNVTPLNFQEFAANQNLNANTQQVSNVLDRIRPAPGIGPRSVEAPLFDDLYDEDTEGDDSALNSLSGQGQAANPGAMLASFATFADAIGDRQAMMGLGLGGVQAALSPRVALNSGQPVTVASDGALPFFGGSSAAWSGWSEGLGQWSRIGNDAGLPGSHSSGGGFALGIDHAFSPEITAGAAFGYVRTLAASEGTDAMSNTYAGALYGSWLPGAWVFDGRIAGGTTASHTSRVVTFPGLASESAQGSVGGWGVLAAGEAGYRLGIAGATVEPYAGITAQTFHQAAFTETSDFGLSFPAQSFNKVTSRFGARAATRFQAAGVTLEPQAQLAWAHDWHDDSLTMQAALFDAPFQLQAARPGRDAAVVGLDLVGWQAENLMVFVAYNGEFRGNAISNGITGGFRARW